MNELAPSDNAQNARGPYKIGRKLERALGEYITNGGVITDAAQAAGMSREALSRALKRDHVRERLDTLMADFKVRSGMKALGVMDRLMDKAKSEYVRLEAAKTMADRAGHAPPKDNVVADTTLVVNIKLG